MTNHGDSQIGIQGSPVRLAEGDDVGLIKGGYQRACDAVDTGSLVRHPNLRSENRGGEQQHDRESARHRCPPLQNVKFIPTGDRVHLCRQN